MRLSREQYVRPPLVAAEPPSARVALWRYRAVASVLALVALLLLAWLFLTISGVGSENPNLGALSPTAAR